MYHHLIPNHYNNNNNNHFVNERSMSVPQLMTNFPTIYNNYSNNISHDISKMSLLSPKLHQLRHNNLSNSHSIYNCISQTPTNYNRIPMQFMSPLQSPLYMQYQYHSPLSCSPRFIKERFHKAKSHLCKNKGCNEHSYRQCMDDNNSVDNIYSRYVDNKRIVKKIKLKRTNSSNNVFSNNTQIEFVNDLDDDKYILINKSTLKEILDNKLKSLEHKQQNDFNHIASLISKENEAIPHIIKAVPKLIEMKIKENEQRKQIDKLKEEQLLNKIKQDFHIERKTILQGANNSFQVHQITQLPSLYIEANHKPTINVSAIVKEKVLEHAIQESMMTGISKYVDKDVLVTGKEKGLSKSKRKKVLMKEQQLEMDVKSKVEKNVKFDTKDKKKNLTKKLKAKSDIMEDNKSSRNKKKNKKEKIINNNNIEQQSTLTNKENENDDDDNKEQIKEKKRKKKKKK